jgi:hypothetical protein
MKKNDKRRLFEVVARLDKTFKPKLNENYSDYLDTNYDADGMSDYHADKETQKKAEDLYDAGLKMFNAGDVDGAEKLRQEALKISSGLGWGENELPPYELSEDAPPFNSLDPNLERDTPEYDDAVSKHYAQFGIKASMVVLSHLSDAQIEISVNPKLAKVRMNFVKYLINKLGGNLNTEINPEEMFEDFKKEYNIDMSKIN